MVDEIVAPCVGAWVEMYDPAVAISSDGRLTVSGSDDKTLKVWDLASGNMISRSNCNYRVSATAFSPDGKTVVARDERGTIYFLALEGFG